MQGVTEHARGQHCGYENANQVSHAYLGGIHRGLTPASCGARQVRDLPEIKPWRRRRSCLALGARCEDTHRTSSPCASPPLRRSANVPSSSPGSRSDTPQHSRQPRAVKNASHRPAHARIWRQARTPRYLGQEFSFEFLPDEEGVTPKPHFKSAKPPSSPGQVSSIAKMYGGFAEKEIPKMVAGWGGKGPD